jgi:drug/metabolite transporter (DMT)-like permease
VARAITYVKLTVAANLWGTTFAISKILLGKIDVFALITLRMIFGLVAMLAYLGATRRLGKIKPMFNANRKWMCYIGVLFFALAYIVQYTAILFTTTFNQAVLLNLQAFFVIAINKVHFKRKATRFVLVGVVVAFFGALLINFKADLTISLEMTIWGDLMTVGACVLWACFTAFSKPISAQEGSDPIVFNTIIIIIATCVLLPFGIFSPGGFVNLPSLGIFDWLCVIWLGSACVGLTYVLWFSGLKEIDSSRVVVFVYMEPIFAGILTFLLPSLGEELSWFSFIGMAICFLGIWLAQHESKKKVEARIGANKDSTGEHVA